MPGHLVHEKTQKFNVSYMRKLKDLMFYDAPASNTWENANIYVLWRSSVYYMRKLKNLMSYMRQLKNLMFYDAPASTKWENSKIECFMTSGRLVHEKTQKFNVLWPGPRTWENCKIYCFMTPGRLLHEKTQKFSRAVGRDFDAGPSISHLQEDLEAFVANVGGWAGRTQSH